MCQKCLCIVYPFKPRGLKWQKPSLVVTLQHVIIEANEGVIKRGEEWAKKQPHPVKFMHGLWQDKVAELPDNYLDGVLYDPYPLTKEEQHTHQFDFIKQIYTKLKPDGILTYCNLTSIGVLKGRHKKWEDLWRKTQVPHLEKCGFRRTWSVTNVSFVLF
jgi:guanidinoacetate N-methyltransferase